MGGKLAIPGPPRQKTGDYPGTYDDKNANTQLSCKPFFRILDDLTDHQYQAREYGTVFRSRVDYFKATDFPPKQITNPLQDVSNANATKVELWRNYVRQFGYGESKLPLSGLSIKTSRHGFSSFLKYENSPYSKTNGMYEPSDPYKSELVSKFSSDGVIPYIFIDPEITANPNPVTENVWAWAAAQYQSDQNINDLFNMFPEEELFELMSALNNATLPGGWAALTDAIRKDFYGQFSMSVAYNRAVGAPPLPGTDDEFVFQLTQPTHLSPHMFRHPKAGPQAPFNTATASPNLNDALGGSEDHQDFVFQRLFRTFGQFSANPSGVRDIGILQFMDLTDWHQNRLAAPAVSCKYKVGNDEMLTFPFRILCPLHTTTADDETHYTEYRDNLPDFRVKDSGVASNPH